MSRPLLPDDLWSEIEALFPVYVPSPDGGRPPKDTRRVLTALLFILKTGIGWKICRPRRSAFHTRPARGGSTSGPTWACGNRFMSCSSPSCVEPTNWIGRVCWSIRACSKPR